MTDRPGLQRAAALGFGELAALPGGLLLGRRGPLALLLLDRPERGNAFDSTTKRELAALWPRLGADRDVRAVVLGSSTDRFFCTGRDLKEVDAAGEVGADLPLRHAVALTARQAEVWKPVVCAVEGRVVGGGLHFVADADLVVAGDAATFQDTHVEVGFVAGTELLGVALKAGLGTALYLALAGREVGLDAARAVQLGLVQEVVPAGTALDRAVRLAEVIARASPAAVRGTLEALWGGATFAGHEQALRHGWLLLRRQWDHPDATEGPRAFAERRRPEWTE